MRASERAYEALRRDILNWDLPPGSVLAEVELSERLGVSRTPVREAVAKLVADGLADAQRGRGTVVSDVSLDDLADMFVLRRVLETESAQLAAASDQTEKFVPLAQKFRAYADDSQILEDPGPYYQLINVMDELIDDAAGNSYLSGALSNLRVHLARVRRMAKDDPARLAASAVEHSKIAEAIARKDQLLARAATIMHLQASLDHILTHAETPKGPHE
ncbi:GntR family transcriptional regulator [Enteractinococcus fodinae]|uniref:DNA-binding GntR family transcriptional regulator n=1 Tax=Enteractinococcus fodinae TaxID=684663 RepID=A0ABU2B2C4_9MICC|nr:GntR family transcriptional regulator [Enteractinococcus fodinae]MDR7347762.1 DNA-binding GntR family transcriptional regulator [Enteractinococcus fodinae]